MYVLTKKILKKYGINAKKDEIFVRIPEWNRYYISNYGTLIHREGNKGYKKVELTCTNGYLTCCLYKPARKSHGKKLNFPKKNKKKTWKQKTYTIQQLVASFFCENPYPSDQFPSEYLQVHHKDKKRSNNYYQNLMWLSAVKERRDHQFVESIKKMALYNKLTGKFRIFKDIEKLFKWIGVNVIQFIDEVKNHSSPVEKDGWMIFKVNEKDVALQFFYKDELKR